MCLCDYVVKAKTPTSRYSGDPACAPEPQPREAQPAPAAKLLNPCVPIEKRQLNR